MWYAYAVCAGDVEPAESWPHGLTPGMTVHGIAPGPGVYVLVSEVPDALFLNPDPDSAPVVSPAEDPAWVAEAALAHHEVVLAAHLRTDTLPLQFGTVFRSEMEILVHFRQLLPELRRRLAMIEGCEEVEIALECDRELVEESLLAPQRAGWSELPAGRKYLTERAARLQLEEQIVGLEQAAWQRLENAIADQIEGRFSRSAATCAYLVKRNCKELFEIVEKTREQGNGLRMSVSGVWPPYSFAGGDVIVDTNSEADESSGQQLMVPEAGADSRTAPSL